MEEYYQKVYCASRTSTAYKTGICKEFSAWKGLYRCYYVLAILKTLFCCDAMGKKSQAKSALCEAVTSLKQMATAVVTMFRKRERDSESTCKYCLSLIQNILNKFPALPDSS